jgi:hypothetical protein
LGYTSLKGGEVFDEGVNSFEIFDDRGIIERD